MVDQTKDRPSSASWRFQKKATRYYLEALNQCLKEVVLCGHWQQVKACNLFFKKLEATIILTILIENIIKIRKIGARYLKLPYESFLETNIPHNTEK